MKLEIKNIRKTCSACPTQWEGYLDDGRMFYIRYRYGRLAFRISETPTDNVYDAVSGEALYMEQIGDDLDGFISLSRVKEALKEKDIILCGEES